MLKQTSPSDVEQADTALVRRIQNRDEAAFELLFARYSEALTRHAAAMVRGGLIAEDAVQAAADDLVQETFLRVWTRAEQWSGQGSFKSWLYRITTNLALNTLRSQRRHPAQPLAGEDEGPWDEWAEAESVNAPGWLVDETTLGPDAAIEQSEEHARLQRAIDGLPEEKREVFRLVNEMELSIRDAAGQLGIPEGTVKSRLHYAQKRLSESLTSSDSDD